MNKKKITFYEQEIKCDCGGGCMSCEVLSRVGDGKESVELLLNNLNDNEKIEFDLRVLKELFSHNEIFFIDKGININVHYNSLIDDRYLELLKTNVLKYKNTRVFLEILETGDIDLDSNVIDELNKRINIIKKLGVKIGIDDFPEGNTRLFVQKLKNIDFIKIDKQVLLDHERDFINLVNEYILEIKKYNKKAKIIIEGVEKGNDLGNLTELGINGFQGYHFGKPSEIKKDLIK